MPGDPAGNHQDGAGLPRTSRGGSPVAGPEPCTHRARGELALRATPAAVANLRAEGIAGRGVFQVGNTGVDATLQAPDRIGEVNPPATARPGSRLFVVTAHRRESRGPRTGHWCTTVVLSMMVAPAALAALVEPGKPVPASAPGARVKPVKPGKSGKSARLAAAAVPALVAEAHDPRVERWEPMRARAHSDAPVGLGQRRSDLCRSRARNRSTGGPAGRHACARAGGPPPGSHRRG